MKQLNQPQLINRVAALFKGQNAAYAVNAALMAASSIFETCGTTLLRISIASTMKELTSRMLTSLIVNDDFVFTSELHESLDTVVEGGTVPVDALKQQPREDLLKTGLIVAISANDESTLYAATAHGLKLYLKWHSAETIAQAKTNKAALAALPDLPEA